MSRCFYRILNVPREATEQQIKLSYRKLALTLHPDVNGGDETMTARFREVHHAYEVLTDTSKRREYDDNGGITMNHMGGTTTHSGGSKVYSAPAYMRGVKNHRKPNNNGTTSTESSIHSQHFNVKEWRAWHFGENAIIKDSVTQKRNDGVSNTTHAKYFQKMHKKRANQDRNEEIENNKKYRQKENHAKEETIRRMEQRIQERREREREKSSSSSSSSSGSEESTSSCIIT